MEQIIIKRPFLSIQNDWNQALKENNGSAWISCKMPGWATSRHGRIAVEEGKLTASENFRVEATSYLKSLTLYHEDPNSVCTFIPPSAEFNRIHHKSVTCLDVTPGGLGLSTSTENYNLKIWEAHTGVVRRELTGHLCDVYTCRFFPSGLVVLSGGADMQLKIWSAETGQCPVTLRGHTAAVNDTAIVEQGRNIVSVSKDGLAKLWDCGSATCLANVAKVERDSLNCCALQAVDVPLGELHHQPVELEVLTEGKLLVVGTEAGCLLGYGLQTRSKIFAFPTGSAVNCCTFLGANHFVCGLQNGTLAMFDLRNPRFPQMTWEDSESAVLCVKGSQMADHLILYAGRADGTTSLYSPSKDIGVQLSGPDNDPVYSVASDGNVWYTASRDGKVRKYHIPNTIVQ